MQRHAAQHQSAAQQHQATERALAQQHREGGADEGGEGEHRARVRRAEGPLGQQVEAQAQAAGAFAELAASEALDSLEKAVALYRGPFLEDLLGADSAPFEEWSLAPACSRGRAHRGGQ